LNGCGAFRFTLITLLSTEYQFICG